MPRFLEDRLKAQAANKGLNEKQSMRYVFGALNNMNAMHGNVETPKGRAIDAKHARDTKRPSGKQTATSGAQKTGAGRTGSHPARNLGQFLHPAKKSK